MLRLDKVIHIIQGSESPLGPLLLAGLSILVLVLIGRVPIRYNLRNITMRWKTTVLTALSFTAVIALLTVMLAFTNGMKKLTDGSGRPGNVICLADGATDEAFSRIPAGDIAQIEQLSDFVLRENGVPVASRETYLIVNQAVANVRQGRPPRRFLQMRGIEDPLMASRVHEIPLIAGGEWFSEAGVEPLPAAGDRPDDQRTAVQAVLGEGVARELGRDRTPEELAAAKNRERLDVGDTFKMGNRTWIVKGVLKSSGSTFNSEIWAKRALAGAIFGKTAYTSLVLRTKDDATAREFKEFLVKYEKARVAPDVETDYYANLSETSAALAWAIGFVAAIMSVGGIFGVMNTMFAAISQRTGDIGVLRLLGFSRRQVLVSFLLESLVIAMIGGLLGCAIGSLCDGWTATSVVSGHAGGGKSVVLKLSVDANIYAKGILLTLAMGYFGGLFPAISAVRIKLLKALR